MMDFFLTRSPLTSGRCVGVLFCFFLPRAVKENIAYGLPEGSYNMDDVYEAAKNANIHR